MLEPKYSKNIFLNSIKLLLEPTCASGEWCRLAGSTPVEAPGAVGIGILGLTIICIFLVFIFVVDLLTLPHHCDVIHHKAAARWKRAGSTAAAGSRSRTQKVGHRRRSQGDDDVTMRRDATDGAGRDQDGRRETAGGGTWVSDGTRIWAENRFCAEVYARRWSDFIAKRRQNLLINDARRVGLLRTPYDVDIFEDYRVLPSTRL